MGEIRDFTENRSQLEPKRFKVDDDVFECAPIMPAGAATYMAEIAQAQADTAKQITMLGPFLDMIVLPTSAARFAERLKDPVNPISGPQLGNILRWLLEEYGSFPTQQSSNSVSGQAPTGMSSMAGALPVG